MFSLRRQPIAKPALRLQISQQVRRPRLERRRAHPREAAQAGRSAAAEVSGLISALALLVLLHQEDFLNALNIEIQFMFFTQAGSGAIAQMMAQVACLAKV